MSCVGFKIANMKIFVDAIKDTLNYFLTKLYHTRALPSKKKKNSHCQINTFNRISREQLTVILGWGLQSIATQGHQSAGFRGVLCSGKYTQFIGHPKSELPKQHLTVMGLNCLEMIVQYKFWLSIILYLFIVCVHTCVCVHMHIHVHMWTCVPWWACNGQWTTCLNWFSTSSKGVPGENSGHKS